MSTWHNTESKPLSKLNFEDLYESLKSIGLEGYLTAPFLDQTVWDEKHKTNFNELYLNGRNCGVNCAQTLPFLNLEAHGICQKCAGKNTRRHHRKCSLRGGGHKDREAQAREAERSCREYGFDVRVRRGRHGKGVSLDKAGEVLLRALARIAAPRNGLRDAIVATYGSDAKIEIPESGTVSITTDVEADPESIQRLMAYAWGIRILVNGVEI